MKLERLGDLCDIRIGRTPSRSNPDFWGGQVPWATISDLNAPTVIETREHITELAVQEIGMRPIAPGTLLYSFKLTIGKMAMTGIQLYTNEAIASLVPRGSEAILPAYLRFALMTVDGTAGSDLAVKGRTLNSSSLADLRVPVAPLGAQRHLVAWLTDRLAAVDHARQVTMDQIATVVALRANTYEQAFQSITPLTAAREPDGPPSGWRWTMLSDLARLESGHTPSRTRPDWWSGDVPWVALPDIRAVDGRVISETLETTNAEGISHSSARILPADTVVLSRTASVGFVTRMGRPMATSQDFVNWVCGPDLDPEFLMHLLIRSREYVRSLSSGAVHKTVYVPTVKAFRVCVPEIDEQRRIAARLRDQLASIDATTSALGTQRAAIEALAGALLRRAFTDADAA